MSTEFGTPSEPGSWVGNRNLIVPPDIIPLRRVSPLRQRTRTPWRPRPDGEPVDRTGGREWFGGPFFADEATRDLGTACGSSLVAHAMGLLALVILVVSGQSRSTTPQRVTEPLRMPVFLAMMSDGGRGAPAPGSSLGPLSATRTAPIGRVTAAKERRPAERARPTAQPKPAPAPAAFPTDFENAPEREEVDRNPQAPTEKAEVAPAGTPVGGGVGAALSGAGSDGGGGGSGNDSGSAGVGIGPGIAMSPGAYRLGQGIEPPRKIKDVKPGYPSGAMALRAIGTVVIEALVGTDGRVHEAKVIHSVPQLDQAALDAVLQWEFTPGRLNGVAVAVIVTVLVKFNLY